MLAHFQGGADCIEEAARIGFATAGKIQCRPVINRCSYDGQTKGDITRSTEALVLEHGQALIVEHR